MPQVDHLGCYFHYTQAVFQKTQSFGLIIAYKNNRPFQLLCRKIFEINHAISNFDNLEQSSLYPRLKIFFPKIEYLVNYVEKKLSKKLDFLCETFMIDHKSPNSKRLRIMACFLGQKNWNKPPIFMGSSETVEKTGKNHKKSILKKFER